MHEIKSLFLGLSTDQKTRLLALVAHNLTVCARIATFPELRDALARRKFTGINELLHVVTAHVMHMVCGDQDRYPDDVFIDILIENAQTSHCEGDLLQSFQRSYSVL
jgi:hypothetical protein